MAATAPEPLLPLDEPTFVRMLRYALATGGERLHFRPGTRPLLQGMGPDRELRYRQMTGDDTLEVAGFLLGHAPASQRLQDDDCDAAREVYLYYELPGQALVEAQFESTRYGLAVHLDILRPLPHPHDVEVVER